MVNDGHSNDSVVYNVMFDPHMQRNRLIYAHSSSNTQLLYIENI